MSDWLPGRQSDIVWPMDGYSIVPAAEAADSYAGTSVPGEFRRLTGALARASWR